GERAESAKGLAQGDPGVGAQCAADRFGVGHDLRGPKMRQVPGLFGGSAAGSKRVPADRCGQAGTALIQHQYPVVLQRLGHPATDASRSGSFPTRATLKTQQPGLVTAAVVGKKFARVHGELYAVRRLTIQLQWDVVVAYSGAIVHSGRGTCGVWCGSHGTPNARQIFKLLRV